MLVPFTPASVRARGYQAGMCPASDRGRPQESRQDRSQVLVRDRVEESAQAGGPRAGFRCREMVCVWPIPCFSDANCATTDHPVCGHWGDGRIEIPLLRRRVNFLHSDGSAIHPCPPYIGVMLMEKQNSIPSPSRPALGDGLIGTQANGRWCSDSGRGQATSRATAN